MFVPAVAANPMVHLRNNVLACPTFTKLVQVRAPAAVISDRIHLIEADDRKTTAGAMVNPIPRAIIAPARDGSSLRGPCVWDLNASFEVEVQFHHFTDDELKTWYSITGTVPASGLDDHVQHYQNIRQLLHEELRESAEAANCLFFREIDLEGGLIDLKTENDKQIWIIKFTLTPEGIP